MEFVSASGSTELRAGDMLGDKYVILRVLGEGGMGIVYEAEHTRLGQRVAIKMLRDSVREQDDVVKRFDREARAAARLKGNHVAHVKDVDVLDDGTPYMVMEYLDGHDLGDEIDQRGSLPIEEAVRIGLETCSAMAEAHAMGVVHRDLKPSNLYLAENDDGTYTTKVLDFGISKLILEQDTNVTMTRSSLGTPMYMSPEQIRSARAVDARTDVWSLGVILYEMLTGSTPFDGENATAVIASVTADPIQPVSERRHDVPPGLEVVVMKALEKVPEKRYASIVDFAEALAMYAADPGAWAPPSIRSSSGSMPGVEWLGQPLSSPRGPLVGSNDATVAGDRARANLGDTQLAALDDNTAPNALTDGAAAASTLPNQENQKRAPTNAGWSRATPVEGIGGARKKALMLVAAAVPLLGGAAWYATSGPADPTAVSASAEPASPGAGAVDENAAEENAAENRLPPSPTPRTGPKVVSPEQRPEVAPALGADAGAKPQHMVGSANKAVAPKPGAGAPAPEKPASPVSTAPLPATTKPAPPAPKPKPAAPTPPRPVRNPVHI